MMQFIHFMILMHCLQLELTEELDLYEPHPPIHAALFLCQRHVMCGAGNRNFNTWAQRSVYQPYD